MLVAQEGHERVAELMLQHGAEVNLQVASIDAPTDDNLFAEPVLTEPLSLNGGDAPLQVASVVPLPPGAGGGDN